MEHQATNSISLLGHTFAGRWFPNIRSDLKSHSGDWTRQGFWAMVVYRFGRWRYNISLRLVRQPFSLIYKILYKIIFWYTTCRFYSNT